MGGFNAERLMKTTEVSLLRMCGGGIRADDKSDVCRNRVADDLLTWFAAEAEIRLEVGYKGSSLHQCGLINHCPLPPPWGERLFLSVFRAFSVATYPQIIRCPGKGGEAIRAFFFFWPHRYEISSSQKRGLH